ncbi:MAG TPA: hypothetical protein PLO33_10930 [Kouleothrix sp.]|uniref:hypothetical protein n=1 Tax=Kouleothrix sp. TaxID=2779161 RepID=UPI002C8A3C49|nr:hypothetical protein [Kouleothrix sp.]HRC76183.1 hypothetical protein [Kouleothrix sp.]
MPTAPDFLIASYDGQAPSAQLGALRGWLHRLLVGMRGAGVLRHSWSWSTGWIVQGS